MNAPRKMSQQETWDWIHQRAVQGLKTTYREAAEQSGRSQNTVDRWFKNWRTSGNDPRDVKPEPTELIDDFENEMGVDGGRNGGNPHENGGNGGSSPHAPPTPASTLVTEPDGEEPFENGGGGDLTECHRSSRFQELTLQQEQAVFLRLLGKDHSFIARQLGVTRETVSRWMNSAPVKRAVERIAAERHQHCRPALSALAADAIDAEAEALQEMRLLLRGDVSVIHDAHLRFAIEEGLTVNIHIDARTKLAAARTINQISRTILDRGGFGPSSRHELHHSGSVGLNLSLADYDHLEDEDLEASYEEEWALLQQAEAELAELAETYEDADELEPWEAAG